MNETEKALIITMRRESDKAGCTVKIGDSEEFHSEDFQMGFFTPQGSYLGMYSDGFKARKAKMARRCGK